MSHIGDEDPDSSFERLLLESDDDTAMTDKMGEDSDENSGKIFVDISDQMVSYTLFLRKTTNGIYASFFTY